MDKLLDLKDYKLYRFTCDCKSPEHSLDLGIDCDDDEKIFYYCFMESYLPNQDSWLRRFKNAIKIILGKEIVVHETYIAPKDVNDLIGVFQEAKNINKGKENQNETNTTTKS
jgi:hypothetical protein